MRLPQRLQIAKDLFMVVVDIYWDDPAQTILIEQVRGAYTAAIWVDTALRAFELMRPVSHTVDVILYPERLIIPERFFQAARYIDRFLPPNQGIIVAVDHENNLLVQMLALGLFTHPGQTAQPLSYCALARRRSPVDPRPAYRDVRWLRP